MLLELSGVWCSMSEYSVLTPMRTLLLGMIVKFDVKPTRRFVSTSGSMFSSTG